MVFTLLKLIYVLSVLKLLIFYSHVESKINDQDGLLSNETSIASRVQEDKTAIRYIHSGAYGCIYTLIPCSKPNIQSHLRQLSSHSKYVSKILIEGFDNDDEVSIGKRILMIPQYGNYYAPILNSCSANPEDIIQEERDYCHLFASGKYDHFATSRMRYVGDDTLVTYLDQKALIGLSDDLKKEIKGVYETHIHLLKALSKLLDARDPIVHYDLKDSNVVYDDTNNVPIIIDFGMSFTKSQLFSALGHPEKLHRFFWNYQAKEDNSVDINWPIEVEVLSYINKYRYKVLDQDILSSDIEELKSVIHRFIKKDLTYNQIDTINFQSQMKHYLSSYKSKKWRNLTEDLMNTWNTWDNYGIAFTYYKYLQTNPFLGRKALKFTDNEFIIKYTELIEKMVFATPETRRLSPKETMHMLSEIWKSYSGIDNSKKINLVRA